AGEDTEGASLLTVTVFEALTGPAGSPVAVNVAVYVPSSLHWMVGVSEVPLVIAHVAPGSVTTGLTVQENVRASPFGSVAEPFSAIVAPSAPDAGSTVTVGGTLLGRTA